MSNLDIDKVKCQYCPYLQEDKYKKGRRDGYNKAREEIIRIIDGSSLEFSDIENLKKLIKERTNG